MKRRDPIDSINTDGGGYHRPPQGFVYNDQSPQINPVPSPGFQVTAPLPQQQIITQPRASTQAYAPPQARTAQAWTAQARTAQARTAQAWTAQARTAQAWTAQAPTYAQAPTQAYAPAQTWTAPAAWTPAPAQTQAYALAPTYAPAQTWTASAAWTYQAPTPTSFLVHSAPAQAPIVDPTRYTLIVPQRIRNNTGSEYTWQDIGNRNFNVFSDQRNAIYSAMHVDNIVGANKVKDGGYLYANFTKANGDSQRFQGLHLGEFVYFNYTTETVYVGGDAGFLLPPNNLYTLDQSAVQMNYAAHQQNVPVPVNIGAASYQRNPPLNPPLNPVPAPRSLQGEINRSRVRSEYPEEGPWFSPFLSIFSSAQKNIQSTVSEIRLGAAQRAQAEAERARDEAERARDEAEQRTRDYAERARVAEDRATRVAAEAQAARVSAETRAAAERERAAAAEARVAEARAAERERAAEALRAAETRARAAETQAAETARAAAQAAADAAEQRAQAARAAQTARAAEDTLRQQLADETAQALRVAEARARAAQARANTAEEEFSGLGRSITGFKTSLENIQLKFTQLKSLFENSSMEHNKKYDQINFKEEGEEIRLKWLYEKDKLIRPINTPTQLSEEQSSGEVSRAGQPQGYNIYTKFTAFSSDVSSKDNEQDALTQIALLKIKLIKLGRDNDSNFSDHHATIAGYLGGVKAEKQDLNFEDQETQEFCKEYFLLGQQYKKIIDQESKTIEKGIQKMMSFEFKKGIATYANKNAKEYLGYKEDDFNNKLTDLSNVDFSNISEDNKDKIILYNGFVLSLEQACRGNEEVLKNPANEIKITPEFAKVFVSLEDEKAKEFWNKLEYNKQIQLKELIKQEEEYSHQQNVNVLGEFELKVKEVKATTPAWATNWIVKRREDSTKKSVRKSGEGAIKEVSDFFEEREKKCQSLIKDLKLKDQPQTSSPDVSGGGSSAVEKKDDEFSKFLDSLNSIIGKFNKDFRKILGDEEEETLPARVSVQAAAGRGEEGGGVRDWRGHESLPAPAPAAAPAAAPGAPAPAAHADAPAAHADAPPVAPGGAPAAHADAPAAHADALARTADGRGGGRGGGGDGGGG